MELSPYWEANSWSAVPEHGILTSFMFHNFACNSSPFFSVHSLINPDYTDRHYLFMVLSNSIFPDISRTFKWLFLADIPNGRLYEFLFNSRLATSPAISFPSGFITAIPFSCKHIFRATRCNTPDDIPHFYSLEYIPEDSSLRPYIHYKGQQYNTGDCGDTCQVMCPQDSYFDCRICSSSL